MKLGQVFFELYNVFLEVEEKKFAKHTISAIVLGALDTLEDSGKPITPENIEEAFRNEIRGLDLPSEEKKVS